MCSTGPRTARRKILRLALLLLASTPCFADQQAWLVTYGPGEVYWQRFGHNAIWLQEPGRGLDHTFNFGFFDFEQESFLKRFVQGRMLYFSAAVPADREMSFYREEGRSIRVQKLALDPQQYARLRDHLVESVKLESRNYLYDYYLDNCSTRLRDALDLALEGALEQQFKPEAARQTFRQHTRRSTHQDFWYYLGLETALGVPVDQPISRWQEMFLPAVLADSLAEVFIQDPGGRQPLVGTDELIEESALAPPPQQPPSTWHRYLALSLALLALAWAMARLAPVVLVEALMQAWMLNAGFLGVLMTIIWLWTDHGAAYPNANLFLLNPLMMLALVPAWRRPAAVITMVGLLAALAILALPSIQYTRDVAALIMPLHLASIYRLWFCDPPKSIS